MAAASVREQLRQKYVNVFCISQLVSIMDDVMQSEFTY